MSLHAIVAVWNDPTITNQTDLLVMLALADYSDERWECYPSLSGIADKARLTERGVHNIIWRLEKAGKINVLKGRGVKTSNGITNRYRIIPGVNGVQPYARYGVNGIQPVEGYGVNGIPKRGEPGSCDPVSKPVSKVQGGDRAGHVFALPDSLNTPEFIEVWIAWREFRAAGKKKLSDRAQTMQLKDLEQYGVEVAIKTVQHSMKNDYTGLFPDRFSKGKTPPAKVYDAEKERQEAREFFGKDAVV